MAIDEKFSRSALATVRAGEIDHDHVPEPERRIFNRQREQALIHISIARQAFPSLPPVHFGFVDRPDVNAWVWMEEKEVFIGITGGAVLAIADWCSVLCQDNDVLEHLSHVHASRGVVSLVLYDLTMNFLLWHELTHVLNGHLHHLYAESAIQFIEEVGFSERSSAACLKRQTIEMDADSGAACKAIVRLHAQFGDAVTCDHMLPLLLAHGTLFRMFGELRNDKCDLTEGAIATAAYPPAPIRLANVFCTAQEMTRKRFGEDFAKDFWRVAALAVNLIEKNIAKIAEKQTSVQGMFKSLSPEANQYICRLLNHWKEHLRPALLPHAFDVLPD